MAKVSSWAKERCHGRPKVHAEGELPGSIYSASISHEYGTGAPMLNVDSVDVKTGRPVRIVLSPKETEGAFMTLLKSGSHGMIQLRAKLLNPVSPERLPGKEEG